MVRRFAQVSLAVFLVLAVAAMASAAPNVANTTQKGSLLVFPKIAVYGTAGAVVNTYIFIANDATTATYIKCYWMDNNQSVEDFHFSITANQPIYIDASNNTYGPDFGVNRTGALTCWASNAEDTAPVAFNHLYGYAMITTAAADVFYNGFSFATRGANFYSVLNPDPLEYQLNLNADTGYDGCPKYLVTTFMPFGQTSIPYFPSTVVAPDITLWPCKQDLRQDRIPTCTKAKYDVWDYMERKYTGSYQCLKCWFEGFLHQTGSKATPAAAWIYNRGKGFGGDKFLLPGDVARLRVQGVKSSVCYGNTRVVSEGITCTNDQHVPTPFLGVLLYANPLALNFAPPADEAPVINAVAGHTMHGAGWDTTGFIKADGSTAVAAPVR